MAAQVDQLSLLDDATPRPEPPVMLRARQDATQRDSRPDNDQPSPTAGLLTTVEAAKLLHVHPRTVQRLVERGELSAVHLGGAVRFDPGDLDGLIAGNKQQHGRPGPRHTERARAGRGARVSFAERLRSDRNEHRAANA